jgi:hypothetical protein
MKWPLPCTIVTRPFGESAAVWRLDLLPERFALRRHAVIARSQQDERHRRKRRPSQHGRGAWREAGLLRRRDRSRVRRNGRAEHARRLDRLVSSAPLERVEDLAGHRILDFRTDPNATALSWWGHKAAKRVTISPVLRSNEPEILIQAARQHAGIAVVSTSLVGELLAGGELVRLLPEWRMPTRDVNALYAPGRG